MFTFVKSLEYIFLNVVRSTSLRIKNMHNNVALLKGLGPIYVEKQKRYDKRLLYDTVGLHILNSYSKL